LTTNKDDSQARISEKIQQFVSDYVSRNSAKGLVIGLSGGLDSSVTLKLIVNAIGPRRVLGLIMPSDTTPKEDIHYALELAKSLEIEHHKITITPIIKMYEKVLPINKRARGNLMARIRMNLLYYHAAINNYLVVGTSDKSELFIGYFTKFGDGAADILPIAELYKTQVRTLAKHLSIPEEIINKKSSPQLWDNHLAEDEIGIDYETLDSILHSLIDRKLDLKSTARKLQIQLNQVKKVKEMIDKSQHKRKLPAQL